MEVTKEGLFTLISVKVKIDAGETDEGGDSQAADFHKAFLEHWVSRLSIIVGEHGGEILGIGDDLFQCSVPDADTAVNAACALQDATVPKLEGYQLVAPLLRVVLHPGDVVSVDHYDAKEALDVAEHMSSLAAWRQILVTDIVYGRASSECRERMRLFSGGKKKAPSAYEVDWEGGAVSVPEDEPEEDKLGTQVFKFRQEEIEKMVSLEAPPPEEKPELKPEPAAPTPVAPPKPFIAPKSQVSRPPEPAPEPIPVPDAREKKEEPPENADEPAVSPKHMRLSSGGELALVDRVVPCATIGRNKNCDLPIQSPSVSRNHAKIIFRDDGFYLIDHSKNGSFVYTERGTEMFVHKYEYRLPHSGRISLGRPKDKVEAKIVMFRTETGPLVVPVS